MVDKTTIKRLILRADTYNYPITDRQEETLKYLDDLYHFSPADIRELKWSIECYIKDRKERGKQTDRLEKLLTNFNNGNNTEGKEIKEIQEH